MVYPRQAIVRRNTTLGGTHWHDKLFEVSGVNGEGYEAIYSFSTDKIAKKVVMDFNKTILSVEENWSIGYFFFPFFFDCATVNISNVNTM